MRTIAVINQKGGVGKTTSSVNLAAALARAGKQVLLIDLDPQAHATLHLGVETADAPTIYDVLTGSAAIAEATRLSAPRLSVAPAHVDLVATEIELVGREHRESVLRSALLAYREYFDFVIIDCAPSLGLLTLNALVAAEEVFIPLQPHFLALQGLGKLLETVTLVRGGLNPGLRVSGVVLCMYEPSTRLAQEVSGDVERFLAAADERSAWFGARVFKTRIRRNIKLAESPSFGKSIFDYAAGSHGAEDYLALAREVLAMERVVRSASASATTAEPPRGPAEAPTVAAEAV